MDFPDKASGNWKFLTEEECAFVIRRIDRDRQDAEPEAFTLRRFLKPALDIKIWGYAVLFGSVLQNQTWAFSQLISIFHVAA